MILNKKPKIMKKNIVFAAAFLSMLSLISCSNNEDQVRAVRLDKTAIELVKGENVQLKATVVPEQDAEFTWFSQDDKYVTVDENGLVTAVGLKKESEDSDEISPVSVYVKYLNGADECKVTVLPLPTEKVEIVYDKKTVEIKHGESVTLTAKCYPEDADLTEVTWSTENALIATVNKTTGKVTGVAPGFTIIKVSYNDKIYDEINLNVLK